MGAPQNRELRAEASENSLSDFGRRCRFTGDDQAVYRDWDERRRVNHVEAITTGELGYLANRLDLTADQKDSLFAGLSRINSVDLFEDLTGVATLEAIARQADTDIARRREAFTPDLTPDQLQEWEKVVSGYRRQLLQRFGHTGQEIGNTNRPPSDQG